MRVELEIEGKRYHLSSFNLSIQQVLDQVSGYPTSPIIGGLVNFQFSHKENKKANIHPFEYFAKWKLGGATPENRKEGFIVYYADEKDTSESLKIKFTEAFVSDYQLFSDSEPNTVSLVENITLSAKKLEVASSVFDKDSYWPE